MAIKVDVSWTDSSPTTHLDHYEIWRKTGSGGTYAQVSGNIGLGVEYFEDVNGGQGLTDGQEYFYQVRAYNDQGQYSDLEGSVVTSGTAILFQDNFAGTTIDTAKWNVNNPSTSQMTYTQNNELIVEIISPTSSTVGADYLGMVDTVNLDTLRVLSWEMKTTDPGNTPTVLIGVSKSEFSVDRFYRMEISLDSNTASVNVVNLENNVAVTTTNYVTDLSTYKRFKMLFDGSYFTVYAWTGVWTEIAAAEAMSSAGVWYPYILFRTAVGQGVAGDIFNVDNYVWTDADYSTEYPTGFTP